MTQERDTQASALIKTAIERLNEIEKNWKRSTPLRRSIAISQVRHDLADAVTLLNGGDANT